MSGYHFSVELGRKEEDSFVVRIGVEAEEEEEEEVEEVSYWRIALAGAGCVVRRHKPSGEIEAPAK